MEIRDPGISRSAVGRNRYSFYTIAFLVGDPLFLSEEDALSLSREWGQRCVPVLGERELMDKIADAKKKCGKSIWA